MSRLSFRPRPLDIHKKLPIVKSVKELEDEETPTSTRNSQLLRLAAEADNEVHHVPCKKLAPDIPTPEFVVVDTYEIDYSRTFSQPTSYLRGRGARTELGEFVEYDLDNEDEDWLQDLNNERKTLTPERFESFLFKLEVLDHKARERAGIITTTLGSPVPVLLQQDNAVEALQSQAIRHSVVESVYKYWKEKRERWQKPILRRLQPPPPVNDTNPYNVFRPREKAHRLHTRRMQRRENNVQSFEKLRQVRRNLDQAKTLLETLIKREEKKRDLMESEVNLQRVHLKYKHETELLEESLALPRFSPFSCKFGTSEDELAELDDFATSRIPRVRASGMQNPTFMESNMVMLPTESLKQEYRQQQLPHGWLHNMDPLEPILLFAKPLVPEKLAAADIIPPMGSDCSMRNGVSVGSHKLRGRIGRGGRIIFDRWNSLAIDCSSNSYYTTPPTPPHLAFNN